MQFGVHVNLLVMSHLRYYLGDDIVQAETPCLQQLMNQYEETQSSVIGVQTVPENETHRYGIIDPVQTRRSTLSSE